VNTQTISILLVYFSVVVAYVYFRTWGHGAPAETYKSPLGRPGAVCAAVIFLFVLCAMPFRVSVSLSSQSLRSNARLNAKAFAFVVLYLALMSVYYMCVARGAQTTTEAEAATYLSVYALKGGCTCC
jgi:DMSO/TMAO reductase YedYZ heme-binding membrane subunit